MSRSSNWYVLPARGAVSSASADEHVDAAILENAVHSSDVCTDIAQYFMLQNVIFCRALE